MNRHFLECLCRKSLAVANWRSTESRRQVRDRREALEHVKKLYRRRASTSKGFVQTIWKRVRRQRFCPHQRLSDALSVARYLGEDVWILVRLRRARTCREEGLCRQRRGGLRACRGACQKGMSIDQ